MRIERKHIGKIVRAESWRAGQTVKVIAMKNPRAFKGQHSNGSVGEFDRADGMNPWFIVSPVPKKTAADEREQKFYILWNPAGQTPPTVRFPTYDEAAKIAESMQKRIGLGTMYVMEAVQSFTVTQKSKWEGLK